MPGRALVLFLVFLVTSCAPRPSSPTTRPSSHPTIASLVPAATDLLVGMGAADHLVAISNYDSARAETASLPKVGDYQSVDWERLTTLRPDVLIVFQAPDRLPAGLKQRADDLHIRLVNIRTETLADLFAEITHLGEVAGEPGKAAAALAGFKAQLGAVHERVKDLPKVRTVILRDEHASGAVGTGNFLNDILEIAGGSNVLATPGWPTLDREQLLSLHPDAVLLLLSGVPSQVETAGRSAVQSLAGLPAVAGRRVTVVNEWYSQQPGFHLPELAAQFAAALHPGHAAPTSTALSP